MNQNNNDYIYPFDYFNRRQHKDIEGKIVYVTRLEEGKTQVLFDPFLIIAKHEGQIIAVRLRAKVKSKTSLETKTKNLRLHHHTQLSKRNYTTKSFKTN
jgi:ribosomal protein L21